MKVVVIMLVSPCFVLEGPAQGGGTIYVACRKFVAEKNCPSARIIFVRGLKMKLKLKVAKKNTVKPIILEPFGSMTRWMLGHCAATMKMIRVGRE